ncbi:MAG: FAD-dependent oxidoreductase [Clostridia bacterium]|nr:FAD-dependent oxidoreductase [Clostridia bacterium]
MKYTIEARQGKEYDVIVCGAGTAGIVAAIAAGRQGASVLLLERSFHVGGMLTEGNAGITKFTEHCKDIDQYKKEVLDVLGTDPRSVQVAGGIAHEICMRLIEKGGASGTNGDCGSYVFTERYAAEAMMLDMLEEAGVEILYDSKVCVVDMEGDTLKKVVVANKEGFVEYAAKCFIDSTGDADVAALAGVECHLGAAESDIAEGGAVKIGQMQPMGTMYRVEGVDFESLFEYFETNPGFTYQSCALQDFENIKDSYKKGDMCCFCVPIPNPDPVTAKTRPKVLVQIYVSPSHKGAILLSFGPTHNCYVGDGTNPRQLTRGQNLLIKGALEITEILRREYPAGFANAKVTHVPDIGVRETRHIVGKYVMNAIDVMSGKNFEDSIGCGGHHIDTDTAPVEVRAMGMVHWRFHIPYRVLLPAKVKNLLVAGRAVSATKLASGALRVSVCCMEMGEAAGVAAAMAAKEGVSPDEIDVQAMRKVLIDGGAIV